MRSLLKLLSAAFLFVASYADAQSLSLSHGKVIDVDVPANDVQIVGWDREDISIQSGSSNYVLNRTSSGAQVRHNGADYSDGVLRLRVPTNAQLVFRGKLGDLHVQSVSGDIDVRITTGDVTLEKVAGNIHVEVITGDIVANGNIHKARIVTIAGSIEVGGASGDVHATTTTGDITVNGTRLRAITLQTMTGDVSLAASIEGSAGRSISTHSGDISLSFATGTRAIVEARTFMGNISSDFPLTLQPNRNARGTQTFELGAVGGGGGGPTLSLTTFNGAIRIRQQHTTNN